MRVAGVGAVDAVGISGSAGLAVRFAAIGVDPFAARFSWQAILGRPEPSLRRLDLLGRFACLAAEAAGAGAGAAGAASGLQDDATRERTAIILCSTHGCLDSDVRFQRSLAGEVASGLFAYTLPSTCLGDLAIRYRLRGPTLCLSAGAHEASAALVEAGALLADDQADAALVLVGDCLPPDAARAAGLPARAASTTMCALLLLRDASRGEPLPGLAAQTAGALLDPGLTVDGVLAAIRAWHPLPDPGAAGERF